MNRSAFHKRLARATVAVVLTISAIGCATAPGIAPTPQTLPTPDTPQAAAHVAPESPPELADVSLPSPTASPPEIVSTSLAEPSPVWIDDTLARRTPLQQTELAVQPPPPEVDAPPAGAAATAPPPAGDLDRDRVASRLPATSRQPTVREPHTDSSSSDSDRDRSLALIEPRIPSPQRPAPSGAASAAPETPAPTDASRAPEATPAAAIPRDTATTDPVSVPSTRDNPAPLAPAPVDAPAPVAPNPTTPAVSAAERPTEQRSDSSSIDAAEPASTRPTTLWNERAAAVASGSEFSVVLPGSGWLYVGKEYGDGEIRLLGKSRSGGDEVFRFRIGEAGEYGLWFQQQDSLSGSLVNERLAVRAAQDEEATSIRLATLAEGSTLASRTDLGSRPTGGRAASGGDSAVADADAAAPAAQPRATGEADRAGLDRALAMLDEGKPADALVAFVDGTERGTIDVGALEDGVLERFAEVARAPIDAEMGRSGVIRSFWRGVASSGSAAAPEARRALLEIAARAGDAGEIAAAVSALEAAGEASSDDMTRAAEALLGAGRESDALPLLGRALTRDGMTLDSVGQFEDDRLFALAQFLEQPGPDRDLRSAASLYRLILDDRPLSMHWDDSRSRLEYLRRHYFEVR